MKNNRIYLFAIVIACLSGCQDFLDTEPPSSLTAGNFFKTEEDAYKALVGCYDGLQVAYSEGVAFPVASEVFSDNCFGATGASDGYGYQMIDEFDPSRSPADRNLYEGNWKGYYNALFRINSFLQKFEGVDWEDQAQRNAYEAEVRFLRAYIYFDMVRLWEKVPLLTEPTSDNVPQAEPDDIYTLIAEDLVYAAANLPTVSYASQSTATFGRVTKWAAEALIARVFLFYTGYYGQADLVGVVNQSQALGYVEDVIANGGFSLVDDFANLWPAASVDDYVGERNPETIFSIRYTFTSDYDGNTDGNHWMVMFGIREQSIYPYGNGWGGATVNPELWDAFDDGDTRKSASIISIEDEGLAFENEERQREYTGYYVKKYAPMSDEAGNSIAVKLGGTNFMIGQFQDYVSIRYADVLLMAAELGSPSAQQYFDEVRERAYQGSFSSIPVTEQNLMEERRLEFAFEGIRYWDLLRQGLNVAADALEVNTTVMNAGVEENKVITDDNFLSTRGFQQIPNNQITLSNNVLKQNAGWN